MQKSIIYFILYPEQAKEYITNATPDVAIELLRKIAFYVKSTEEFWLYIPNEFFDVFYNTVVQRAKAQYYKYNAFAGAEDIEDKAHNIFLQLHLALRNFRPCRCSYNELYKAYIYYIADILICRGEYFEIIKVNKKSPYRINISELEQIPNKQEQEQKTSKQKVESIKQWLKLIKYQEKKI